MVELKTNYPENFTVNGHGRTYDLYVRYGSMLLGYITEVVKDSTLAEQYLITVFKEVVLKIDEITQADNTWVKLQKLAKTVLLPFNQTLLPDNCVANNGGGTITNNYLKLMNKQQQDVFCGVHYQQKSTERLAAELNKTQDAVKQLLREALIIIRNGQKR
jgi:hypothetical protein